MPRKIEKDDMSINELARLTAGGFEDLTRRMDRTDNRINKIDGRLDGIDGRLDGIDGRLDGIDGRLDGIDGRLENNDSKHERMRSEMHERFDRFDRELLDVKRELAKVGKRSLEDADAICGDVVDLQDRVSIVEKALGLRAG